jgi:hypothetical protein
MSTGRTGADTAALDREFASRYYEGWVEAWNAHRAQIGFDPLTEDFVLDSPIPGTVRGSCAGRRVAAGYIRHAGEAYPDLVWEVSGPSMFSDDLAPAAFSWRGSGHVTGRTGSAGIDGAGWVFEFSGLEVFGFRGERGCYRYGTGDVLGLIKQIGVYCGAAERR